MDKKVLAEYGFLMVRPDAFKNNLSNSIYQNIIERGFFLTAAKVLKLTPRQFEMIYEQKAHLFVPNLWLFGDIYRNTPCVAMVFKRSTNTDSRPVPEIFDTIKGNSSPIEGERKGIREEYGRISSFHGIVHCSDSIEACLNDLQVVFSDYELDTILKNEYCLQNKLKSEIIHFYLENDENKINSFDIVQFNLYLIKKIISTLCVRCLTQLDDADLSKFENIFDKYEQISLEVNKISDFSKRKKIFSEFQRDNKELIDSLIKCPLYFNTDNYKSGIYTFETNALKSDFTLLKLSIAILGAYEGYNKLDCFKFLSVLERGGVYLTEWQQNILLAALTTDLNADRYWGGKPCYEMAK